MDRKRANYPIDFIVFNEGSANVLEMLLRYCSGIVEDEFILYEFFPFLIDASIPTIPSCISID